MSKRASAVASLPGGKATKLALVNMLLDASNPRFGTPGDKQASQADILDRIVEKFGVDDVLSSISVNGYFAAEPMVCKMPRSGAKATVAEGNRRLAACLILAGDARASRQANRTEQYQPIWIKHGRKPIDPVPVILFDGTQNEHALLSYLGVRHIASSQPWDSYAKAAWVARVVEEEEISLADVALMIGDQHRTIERLLEGYYFVQQIIDAGVFRPEDSQRKGRGSVTEYPFSWVYTILGYTAARNFLALGDGPPRKNPLKRDKLARAALVTRSMFGDRSSGRSAAIEDSRDIGRLVSALASPEKVSLLEQGKAISEIERATQPIEDRLRHGLAEVREIQSDLIAGMTEHPVSVAVATPLTAAATMNRRTAAEVEKKLREAATGQADDD